MTTKLYRKAFAGIALAVSLLLTGAVPKANASPGSLTSSELLGSDVVSTSSASLLVPDSSDAISEMVNRSVTNPVAPVARFSRPSSATSSILAQSSTEIAQDGVTPVDGTFAPLTDEELRQQLLIDPNFVPGAPRPAPASGFGVPSAFGADWGDAFIGLAGVTEGRTDDKADGSISLGMGFGDAVENIGVEVGVGIISLDGFAEDGSVGVKLHKVFPDADNLAVAVGWSNPITWGDANSAEDTFYGVVTKQFALQPERNNTLPLTASVGVGTGSFRSKGAIDAGNNALNVFGSLGLQVIPELSIVSGWTGSALGLGVSTAPFDFPLVLTAGVSDVTGNTRSGARVNASVGYSFSF
ncbi:MAG: hypothetical protein ACFB16_04790 [Phormidesmis sp.]